MKLKSPFTLSESEIGIVKIFLLISTPSESKNFATVCYEIVQLDNFNKSGALFVLLSVIFQRGGSTPIHSRVTPRV